MPPPTDMQQMEMEMVQGMYDTYELISEDPPCYSVLLAANEEESPEIKVTVTYPSEDYPESAPCEIAVETISKVRRLQTAHISKDVETACVDNVGMHTVILVLQQIQEFLMKAVEDDQKAELVRRGERMEAAAVAKAGGAAALADPTIRIGTAVTRELFDEWSKKHNIEKQKAREERDKRENKVAASKLTGRQLWDNSLKSADWTLFGDEGDDEGGEDVDYGTMGGELDEDDFDLE